MNLKTGILLIMILATNASAITLPVSEDTTWVNSKAADGSLKVEAACGGAKHIDCIGVRRGTPKTNIANGIWSAALLNFNYQALPADTAGADVVRATLWIMPEKVTYPGFIYVCAFTGTSWTENIVGYNTPFSVSDPEGSLWVDKTTVNQWQVVDVTQVVQDWLDNTLRNYGFALVPATGTSVTTGSTMSTGTGSIVSVQFASREVGYDSAYLEVVLAGDGAQGSQGPAGTPADNNVIESTLASDQTFLNNVGTALSQNSALGNSTANSLLNSSTFQASLVMNLANNGTFLSNVKGLSTESLPALESDLEATPSFIAQVGTQVSGTVSATLESDTTFALNLSAALASNNTFQINLCNDLSTNTAFVNAARGPQGPAGSAAPSTPQVATGNYGAVNLSFTKFSYNVQNTVQSMCSDGAGIVWAVCQEADLSYSIRKFQGSQELKSGTNAWVSGLRATAPIYCTGDKIWAAEFIDDAGTGAIFVYDAATGAQLQSIQLPSAVATRAAQRISCDGQAVYVLTHATVTKFNVGTLAVSGSFSSVGFDPTLPLAYASDMTSDGSYLWIGCGTATFKTDTSGTVLASYPFVGMNYTYDGTYIWATIGIEGTVRKMSLDGTTNETIYPFSGNGITTALVGDGPTMWVLDSLGAAQINPSDNTIIATIAPGIATISTPACYDGQHKWAMVNGALTRL
jgi:hypothetical protein